MDKKGASGGAGGDVVQATQPSPPTARRSGAVVSADSVAEGLFKKVRLHKLDLEEIIAKTRALLAAANAE